MLFTAENWKKIRKRIHKSRKTDEYVSMELRYVCSEYLVLWRTETFCNDSNGRTSYADQRGGYRFLVFFKKTYVPVGNLISDNEKTFEKSEKERRDPGMQGIGKISDRCGRKIFHMQV